MVRKTRKTVVFRRLYSPLKHALMASKETVGAVAETARDVACDGLTGLDRIGSSVTTHANMAVNDLLGKRGKSRRKTRKFRGKRAGKR